MMMHCCSWSQVVRDGLKVLERNVCMYHSPLSPLTANRSIEPYSCVPMRVDHWGAIQHRLTWFAASTTDDDANICNSMWCDFVYNHSSRYSMLLLYSTLLAWLTHITHDEGITQILFPIWQLSARLLVFYNQQNAAADDEEREEMNKEVIIIIMYWDTAAAAYREHSRLHWITATRLEYNYPT